MAKQRSHHFLNINLYTQMLIKMCTSTRPVTLKILSVENSPCTTSKIVLIAIFNAIEHDNHELVPIMYLAKQNGSGTSRC